MNQTNTLAHKPNTNRPQNNTASGLSVTSISTGTVLIRSALSLTVVLGSLLGLWASAASEQAKLPNANYALRIEKLSEKQPDRGVVLQNLGGIALQNGENIFIEIPTPSGKTVYAAGAAAEKWISAGYRGIPGSPTIAVKPLTELPHADYRQVLELSGNSDFRGKIKNSLDSSGIKYTTMENQLWSVLLIGTSLGDAIPLLLGFCAALCTIGSILNSRAEAIRTLHGFRQIESTSFEIRHAAGRLVPIFLSSVLISNILVALWANIFSALQWFIFQSIIIGGAFAVCALCTLSTQYLLRRLSIPPLVAGKLPVWPVLAATFAIRVGACVAVVAMAVGMVNHSSEWLKQREEEAVWKDLPAAYAVSLSGARALEDIHNASSALAAELRTISTHHRLAFAQFIDPGQLNFATEGRDLLVYNHTAAKMSLSGKLQSAFEGALASYAANSSANDQDTIIWLMPDSLPASFDNSPVEGMLSPAQSQIKFEYHDGGQPKPSAFTWEANTDAWMNRSQSISPIVAIVPDNLALVSDRNLVAAVTQMDVLLLDYEDFNRLQDSPVIGSFLQSPIPMAQTWSESHHAMGTTAWIYLGGFVAALLLAVISAYSSLRTYLGLFRQRLRVSFIHGTLPAKLVLGYVVLETLPLGIVALYLYNRGAPARQWSFGGRFAGSADPSLIAMFNVPTAAWIISLTVVLATSLPILALLFRRDSVTALVQSGR